MVCHHLGLPAVDWNWQVITTLIPTAFAMFVVILAQSAATCQRLCHALRREFQREHRPGRSGPGQYWRRPVRHVRRQRQPHQDANRATARAAAAQLSLLAMAAIVLLVLLFLTGPLAFMPEAALSAIVFLIGTGLIDIAGMRKVFAQRRSEFWVALITALTVVIVGVEQGILLAIALSLVDHTRHGYRPKNAVLVPGESGGSATAAGGDGRSSRARPGHLPIHAQLVLRELPAARG